MSNSLMVRHLCDCVLCLVIVLAPLPLCLSLTLLTENGKERIGFIHGWLTLLTAWCIIETSLGVLLGIFHHLTLGAVLTSELLVFVCGVVVWLSLRRRVSLCSIASLLTWRRPLNNLETLVVGAIAFVGCALLWRIATRPITEYDSLSFHLPVMAKWYQTSSFTMLEQFYNLKSYSPQSMYPYSWEVLCTLFLMPFREDFLAAFPNLIAWMILGLSIYLLSLHVGASRIQSMAASALVLTLPNLVKNVNTLHIDLPFAAFFMVSLYFAVAYHRTRSVSYLALFIASLGMILGIKMSGPVYVGLLVLLWMLMKVKSVVLRAGSVSPTPQTRAALPLCIVSVLICLLVGGFWYARNYVEMGNPLGFVRVKLAGITVFPGELDVTEIRKTTLMKVFQPTRLSHWRILVEQVKSQLHVPFLAMVVLAWGLLRAVLTRSSRIKIESLVGLMGLLVGTGFLYWTSPGSGVTAPDIKEMTGWMGQGFRYGFPFLALLGVTAAAGASAWRIWDEGLVATVLLSSLLSISDIAESNLLYAGVITLLMWGQLRVVSQVSAVINAPRILRLAMVSSLCVLLVYGVTFVMRKRRDNKRPEAYGEVVTYLANHVGQKETIGYLASHRSYLFYGKELNRKVEYVPANTDDVTQWLDTLRQRSISVIAVGPGPQPEEWKSITDMKTALAHNSSLRRAFKELVWLEDPDGPFVRVFGENPGAEPLLYRFKR